MDNIEAAINVSRAATQAAIRRGAITTVRGTNSSLGFRRSVDMRDERKVFDALTRDSAAEHYVGKAVRRAVATRDALKTYDRLTVDSAGSFMNSELKRLDQRLHMPLMSTTWGRDINVRTDVSMADEISSYTNSTFSVAPGIAGSGKSWASKDGNAIVDTGLDISARPGRICQSGRSRSLWTIPELLSAMRQGRPLDAQMIEALNRKYQLDVDWEVYMGDGPARHECGC